MNTAKEDKYKSKIVQMCPPIIVEPAQTMPGNPVWCGNSSIDEYWKRKEEEHGNRLQKPI